MSYLTQMAGLAYHNFVSAATGIALAIAFIRGISQKEKDTLGNFWVDLVRCSLWVLLPFCIVGALALVSQGVVQNLRPYDKVDGPRSADRDRAGCGRQAADTGRGRADHRTGACRLAGNHQGVRHQRRRLHERQQRAPVREPDAAVELLRDGLHLRDLGGAHLHARTDDRIAQARLGGLGRHGVPVSGRRDDGLLGGSAREPAAHRRGRRPDGECARARRQHGRQGVPLRHRQLGALCDGHDRRELRRDQRLARLVHAARRPGAAHQHHAWRSDLRRCRRRHVRNPGVHHPVGLHRGPDGRPDAGIPRQESPGLRRPDGDAGRAGVPADDPRADGDLGGVAELRHVEHHQSGAARPVARSSTRSRPARATTARRSAG